MANKAKFIPQLNNRKTRQTFRKCYLMKRVNKVAFLCLFTLLGGCAESTDDGPELPTTPVTQSARESKDNAVDLRPYPGDPELRGEKIAQTFHAAQNMTEAERDAMKQEAIKRADQYPFQDMVWYRENPAEKDLTTLRRLLEKEGLNPTLKYGSGLCPLEHTLNNVFRSLRYPPNEWPSDTEPDFHYNMAMHLKMLSIYIEHGYHPNELTVHFDAPDIVEAISSDKRWAQQAFQEHKKVFDALIASKR